MFLNETTNEVPTIDEPNHYVRDTILLTLYSITAILALFGNYLVCKIIFAKNSSLRNSTNILVGNLAFSDIIGGITIPGQWIFCSAYAIDNWQLQFPCAVSKSLQVLSFYMSSLIMMLIAIERFKSIVFPMSPPFRSKLYVSITWIVTTIFVGTSIGSAKIFEYFTSDRLISCRIVLKFTTPFNSDNMRTQRVWGIWMGQYVLPLLVTGILYAVIAYKVWAQKKLGLSSNANRDTRKKKIVIMLMIVVVVFTLCWLPLHVLNFRDYVIKQLEKRSGGRGKSGKLCNDSTLYFSLYWLGISSCCYNPFIYWWMNAEFRKGFKRVLPPFVLRYLSKEESETSGGSDVKLRVHVVQQPTSEEVETTQ